MRKRIVLFVATSVVVSGLALWATMGSASAIKAPQTFTVIEKDNQFHLVDNDPPKSSIGDFFALSGPLLRGGTNVGVADVLCTQTHENHFRFLCSATWTFKNKGQITGQTSLHSRSNVRFVAAVTGGTGIYQNVRGWVEVDQPRPSVTRDTFHLLT
jgi:hypothetical protein